MNYKIQILNEEHCKNVQKALFDLEKHWSDKLINNFKKFEQINFIYFSDNDNYLSYHASTDFILSAKELSYSDILKKLYKNNKLVVDLFQYDNVIVGKILYQDEDLRKLDIIEKKDFYSICSEKKPEITENELFIRGTIEDKDDNYFSYAFNTKDDANKWLKNIKELICSVNKNNYNLKFKIPIPKEHDYFWNVSLSNNKVFKFEWYNSKVQNVWFENATIYLTEKAANIRVKMNDDYFFRTKEWIKNYIAHNDDGWRADWNNPDQEKYTFYYNHKNKKWKETIGLIRQYSDFYMSKEMANKILVILNNQKVGG